MLHEKAKFFAIILLSFGLIELKAQETIPAVGGNASGSGGTASYTIGQLIYTTNAGTNGSVAQGIQQPYEISVVSGVDETESIKLTLYAYPNPTTDFLTLKIDASATHSIQSFSYHFHDISGKLLESKRIEGNETSIDMKHLKPAIYILKVIQSNKEVKTFKIIKN